MRLIIEAWRHVEFPHVLEVSINHISGVLYNVEKGFPGRLRSADVGMLNQEKIRSCFVRFAAGQSSRRASLELHTYSSSVRHVFPIKGYDILPFVPHQSEARPDYSFVCVCMQCHMLHKCAEPLFHCPACVTGASYRLFNRKFVCTVPRIHKQAT